MTIQLEWRIFPGHPPPYVANDCFTRRENASIRGGVLASLGKSFRATGVYSETVSDGKFAFVLTV